MASYLIREVWGSAGAPALATVRARSAIGAVCKYLRSQGYAARETRDGMIADAEAPALRADRIASDAETERTLTRIRDAAKRATAPAFAPWQHYRID